MKVLIHLDLEKRCKALQLQLGQGRYRLRIPDAHLLEVHLIHMQKIGGLMQVQAGHLEPKFQAPSLKLGTDQTSRTWRRLYVPQVGQAVCCNFGCWHWLQFAIAAGVVFQALRRWRVRERDIFRFGTGMVAPFQFKFLTCVSLAGINRQERSIPQIPQYSKTGIIGLNLPIYP